MAVAPKWEGATTEVGLWLFIPLVEFRVSCAVSSAPYAVTCPLIHLMTQGHARQCTLLITPRTNTLA